MEYFLDNDKPTHFLSKRQVNLIVGASGAGKTTLMFQLYKASVTGEPFLGMHIPPVKWAYISGDRSSESVRATMERVGVTPEDLPIFSLVDQNMIGKDLCKIVIPALTKTLQVRPELILIDGFSAMVPDGKFNDYFETCKWLGSLQRFCTRQDLSMLGVVHVPKIREGSMIQDPRQQTMGSNAFGGFTEDQLVINRIYKKGHENERTIYILPRNGEERMIKATFQGGLIVADFSEETKHTEGAMFVLESFLIPGATFIAADFEHRAKQKGVGRATYYRWLHKMVEQGRLKKETRGEYRVLAGEVEDILGTYETSKFTEEGQAYQSQDDLGGPVYVGGGNAGQEEVSGLVSEPVAPVERGEPDAGVEEARGTEAASEVRHPERREALCVIEGTHPGIQEDSLSGAAVADSGKNEGSGEAGDNQ